MLIIKWGVILGKEKIKMVRERDGSYLRVTETLKPVYYT